ncbi:MAG: phage head morphogenesis protein [Firmicutes bacterium HGW-Firmicutes-17]|jgi:SPP1 gp7 family putative phage head morphogenesis protein|nr:MAG: phage head morphogenesis protein [Firmicutes bacterium HGW-Firmicutes-17]
MKQADYWKNRFTQLEEAQNQKSLDYYSTLEDEFSRAARNVDKELAAWYTRFAKNENISYEEAKQVLTKGELSAFKMSVEDYIKKGKTLSYSDQWAKELERASAKFHVTRLEAIQLQMQQQIEVMYGYELDTFDQFIANQYKAGYYKTMFEFQKGFGVGFDVMKLDDNKIAKLIAKPWAPDGQNFSSRIWRDKNKLMAEMPSMLTQATIRGDGYAKTAKLLAERFNVSKSQAKNLVITESAFFSSEAQTDCFNNLGVKQYEIIATLDGKTSDVCRMMDGKVFDMKDRKSGTTAPPFHGRCRSTSAPFFNDEFELNTKRAARDPGTGKTYQVPANMKYLDWEKSFVNGGEKDGLEVIKGGIIKQATDIYTTALENGRKSGKESLFLTDQDGNLLYQLDGGKSEVIFDKPLIDLLKNADERSMDFIHNHPSSSSFSMEDIEVVNTFKSIKEMGVIGHDGTKYTLDLNDNHVDEQILKDEYLKARNSYFDFFKKKVVKGKLTQKEAWKEHSDLILKDISKLFNWKYEKAVK